MITEFRLQNAQTCVFQSIYHRLEHPAGTYLPKPDSTNLRTYMLWHLQKLNYQEESLEKVNFLFRL